MSDAASASAGQGLNGAYAGLGTPARLVAAALSGMLAAVALAQEGFGPRGLIDAFVLALLPQLAAIDIQRRVLPNRILHPALAIVLLAQLAFFSDRAGEWILACLGAAAFLALPLVFFRGGVGMGDVKLAALLGAALGSDVVTAITVASFALLPVALIVLARGGREAHKVAIPFGPFLALGGAVAVLVA
jgi:leader peptidase (prepilin peptidase)/N-methyltransferase